MWQISINIFRLQ